MEKESPQTRSRRASHKGTWWKWLLGVIAAIVVIVVALSYIIESPTLHHYMERQMNSRLKGYTVHMGRAYFHPLAFALDLGDLTLVQNANPDPPVAKIGRFYASVYWRALLTARLALLFDGGGGYRWSRRG